MLAGSRKLFLLLLVVMLATPLWVPRQASAHGPWPWVIPDITATVEGDTVTYSITLKNRNSHDVRNLEVIGKIPHGATFVDSWAGAVGTNGGKFTGGEVKWFHRAIKGNGSLGPFVFAVKVTPARSEHPHRSLAAKAYVVWGSPTGGDAVDFLTIANPVETGEPQIAMAAPGHWHANKGKKLTFTITNESGDPVLGIAPDVVVDTLAGRADRLKAVDNGDGTYSAEYTAPEIGSGYETGYAVLMAVEIGGARYVEAWPVEVVRDGREDIMPVLAGTKYAYQVRYGWNPGVAKVGDEVNLIFEPRRAIQTGNQLNTQQPFRNTFNHVADLEDVRILVEKDGQVVREIAADYSGLGIYSARHKFDAPGNYRVILLFTDPANGFSIEKSDTSYPLSVSAAGTTAAVAASGVGIALTPPGHWHATKGKKLTFTITDATSGQPLPGLKPEVTVQTLGGRTDTLTPADNGDGTYTADYTAWEIGSAYATFYSILLTVEKDGVRYSEAWPVEVVRDGREDIMPVLAGVKYAYQVRYGWNPGVAKMGDEVNLIFEPRRATQTGDQLNTQQPFRNTFNHVADLEDVKILVEKDGQVVEELAATYNGLGIYSAKHSFDASGNYKVSLLFTDPANGFSIEKSDTSYPLLVNATGSGAQVTTAPEPGHAMTPMAPMMPPMGPMAPVASLDQIVYDPDTSQSVLAAGKRSFENSCASCHALPTAARIKAFGSDQQMVNHAIGMADMVGVVKAEAENLIRYMLAVRHDTAP
ncbi:MAG: hypothetical protein HY675_16580 [Chloroflexi bacterium]|nr:hypothetical protein [Chloroflexota bacterium]